MDENLETSSFNIIPGFSASDTFVNMPTSYQYCSGFRTRFSVSIENEKAVMRDGTAAYPSRKTRFLRANGDREILFFRVQLTTIIIHTYRQYSASCDNYPYIQYINTCTKLSS